VYIGNYLLLNSSIRAIDGAITIDYNCFLLLHSAVGRRRPMAVCRSCCSCNLQDETCGSSCMKPHFLPNGESPLPRIMMMLRAICLALVAALLPLAIAFVPAASALSTCSSLSTFASRTPHAPIRSLAQQQCGARQQRTAPLMMAKDEVPFEFRALVSVHAGFPICACVQLRALL
jgi:hypothetical protein